MEEGSSLRCTFDLISATMSVWASKMSLFMLAMDPWPAPAGRRGSTCSEVGAVPGGAATKANRAKLLAPRSTR